MIPEQLPARVKLKLAILMADEQTLDRIIEAIAIVCGERLEVA